MAYERKTRTIDIVVSRPVPRTDQEVRDLYYEIVDLYGQAWGDLVLENLIDIAMANGVITKAGRRVPFPRPVPTVVGATPQPFSRA